jgi:hypothetical protein
MIAIQTIISILFFHWLFDFFLQTREMANNKSKSNYYLGQHVGLYSFGLLLVSSFIFTNNINEGLCWIGINGVAHFLTDYVTSRASSALYKEERFHEFFCIIGLDQLIHYVTLFGTYVWLKN